jgi:hypothetical protein
VSLQSAGQFGEGGKSLGRVQSVHLFEKAAVYGSLVERWSHRHEIGGVESSGLGKATGEIKPAVGPEFVH